MPIDEKKLRAEIQKAVEEAILVARGLRPGHRLGGNVVIQVSESDKGVVDQTAEFKESKENGTGPAA